MKSDEVVEVGKILSNLRLFLILWERCGDN